MISISPVSFQDTKRRVIAEATLMQMLIDSMWVDASDGGRFDVLDPGSGELIDRVPAATDDDVATAIAAARSGRRRMAALPAHERSAILVRAADRIVESQEDLAHLLARENGKPIRQTREEVAAAARIFRGFGQEATRLFGRQVPMDAVPGMERHVAFTIRQPVGVVAAIVPFNYPVELYAHKAAAALAAGNAVIGKPPSDCPLAVLRIAAILEEAGLPAAGHQMLTGRGSRIGPLLASDPGVDLVTVTGSVETGVQLGRIAAEHHKPLLAELGGNDPVIVCADADLGQAAMAVVLGRLARGNGQICCAVKRVLVDATVYEAFAAILARMAQELQVGDALDERSDVGPLISVHAAIEVQGAIDAAVAGGATLLAGGPRRGSYIQPTVLADVPATAVVVREETFGPVVPLLAFRTIDDAVAMANDSPYGLQAAVFTRDIGNAMDIAYRLEAGGVMVNWSSALRAENLPFGGLKASGHGREGLHDTLLSMTHQKVILMHDVLRGSPASVVSPG
jgi:acyl-CoA reductase-like NAD-dependent aldehyde dehydrogenase